MDCLCPLNWWCHPTISLSVASSSCSQPFPASESFPMSQLFASGGERTGASASVHAKSIQGRFPLRLSGLTSLLSRGLSRVFSSTAAQKPEFFSALLSFMVQLSHPYLTTGKTIALTITDFCQQSDAFAFYICIKCVILLEKFRKNHIDCPKFQGTAKMGCIWGCGRGAFLCSCNETEFTKLRWLTVRVMSGWR